jgi:hypothetical protein
LYVPIAIEQLLHSGAVVVAAVVAVDADVAVVEYLIV